ncbi:hypothetical protein Tco_0453685 [Tanacetum coccineum]
MKLSKQFQLIYDVYMCRMIPQLVIHPGGRIWYIRSAVLIRISLRWGVCLGGSERSSEHNSFKAEVFGIREFKDDKMMMAKFPIYSFMTRSARELWKAFSRDMQVNSRNFLDDQTGHEKVLKSCQEVMCKKIQSKPGSVEENSMSSSDFVRLTSEEIKDGCSRNIVTNSHVTPSWRGLLASLLVKMASYTKAHLLEDKQIPNVGVFDEVFCIWKAFGRNIRDLGSFREETDKTTDLHQHCSRISPQKLETASQITRDAVTTISKTASQDLKTASDCTCLRSCKTSCRSLTMTASVIHALEDILDKEVILVHEHDDLTSDQSTGNIINVREIPKFLDKVSKNVNVDDLEISIKFNLKKRYGDATSSGMVSYASQIPPPTPRKMDDGVRPSAPPLPQQEVYGYPVTTLPTNVQPPYYYYGSSTSSDDQPNDYPCIIMMLEKTYYKVEEHKELDGSLNHSTQLSEFFLLLLEIQVKDESFMSLRMRSSREYHLVSEAS